MTARQQAEADDVRAKYLARHRRWNRTRPERDAPRMCECQRVPSKCECARLFGVRR